MRTTLHVLSLGSPEESRCVRDALLERQRCHLIAANGTQELSAISSQETIDVAILHASLNKTALRNGARTIRHQWPHARILLVNPQAEIIDDALYEERIASFSSSDALLATIELLAAASRRRRLGPPTWISTEACHPLSNTFCPGIKEVRTQP
jgi:hypothetical protein